MSRADGADDAEHCRYLREVGLHPYADRIEALAAQVELWKEKAHKWAEDGEKIVAEWTRACKSAEAAAEANRRDAERWRVARKPPFGIADWTEFAKPLIRTGTSADERIDAALKDANV